MTFTSVRSRPTSSVRDVRGEAVPLLGDLGDVGCSVGLQFVELIGEAGDLVLGGVDAAAGGARAAAAAGGGAGIAEDVADHGALRLAAAEQAAQQRAGGGEQLRVALGFASFSSTSTRSSAAAIWSRSRRRLGLVLVAQLGDLLVGALVGERRAAGGELLGGLAGAAVELQVGVGRDLQRQAAGEVIDAGRARPG